MTKHFIFTRFSIYDPTFMGFNLNRSKSDDEKIKNELFDSNRLDYKFKCFDSITYPSIKNQTCNNYSWYIFASSILPLDYKQKLNKYEIKNKVVIKIVYVDNFDSMNNFITELLNNYNNNYTTIRLDDDDGLCNTYIEKLNAYIKEKGKIITFPKGIKYKIDESNNNQIKFGSKVYFKNNAQGMCAIGFNIIIAGNHREVENNNYKVIVDDTEDAYFVCCSKYCDTKR